MLSIIQNLTSICYFLFPAPNRLVEVTVIVCASILCVLILVCAVSQCHTGYTTTHHVWLRERHSSGSSWLRDSGIGSTQRESTSEHTQLRPQTPASLNTTSEVSFNNVSWLSRMKLYRSSNKIKRTNQNKDMFYSSQPPQSQCPVNGPRLPTDTPIGNTLDWQQLHNFDIRR